MEMELPERKRPVRGDTPIDILAGQGLMKTGDMPGTDTYDDGLDEKGRVVMPGSTTTGSGGIYMEEVGPNDLRHRGEDHISAHAEQAGLSVVHDAEAGGDDDANDPTARMLRGEISSAEAERLIREQWQGGKSA